MRPRMAFNNYFSRSKSMQTTLKKTYGGQEVEKLASAYLSQHHLTIIEFNFSCKCGEIDLIMQEKDTIVFVEVRYRRSNAYGSSIETVDRRKQQKLLKTAEFYLQKKYQHSPCRFDVIGAHIDYESGKLRFDWVKYAFSY